MLGLHTGAFTPRKTHIPKVIGVLPCVLFIIQILVTTILKWEALSPLT